MKPIYFEPENLFFKAHFYAPNKPFFNKRIDTFWFNTIVIWMISFIMFIILYFSLVQRFLNLLLLLKFKLNFRKELQKNKYTTKRRKKSKFRRFMKRFI